MIIKFVKPSGILSAYIKYYWVLETEINDRNVSERVIPTGNIELMFHYKMPFICNHNNSSIVQPRSFISGMKSDYTDVSTCGDSGVIAVTFYPFGACNFFGFPLLEIENTSVNLNDIDNRSFRLVEEQICLAASMRERISIIEKYLLSRLKPIAGEDLLMIQKGISLINGTKGQISTTVLSEKLFTTSKSLQRKFSALIGKPPKQFTRIVRFQQTISSFSTDKSLTQLAIDNGYFDQAHFIKDFKALSGYTPKEFMAYCPCASDYFR